MNSINMGGGIGLAFTSMTMIGYLGIFSVLNVSGGICAGGLRITKSLHIKMRNEHGKENNLGSR